MWLVIQYLMALRQRSGILHECFDCNVMIIEKKLPVRSDQEAFFLPLNGN
ncbi:hypothetical protein BN439_3054 [Erwinia amylovora Ea644]|nr:hypothetical protein BN439_3054 [Erwinia amylovora Ea644]CCP08151.1 hypothetical protein BN440_3146 [Erwinia amylovora MR1]